MHDTAISRISQIPGLVAISSHTMGGHAEDEEDTDREKISCDIGCTTLISLCSASA